MTSGSPPLTDSETDLRAARDGCDCTSLAIRCAHLDDRRIFLAFVPMAMCECEGGDPYSITFIIGPTFKCADCTKRVFWSDQHFAPTIFFEDYDAALEAFYAEEQALLRGAE